MTFQVTPGQQHEASVFEVLMSEGAVNRAGPGRPRLYPRLIVGDKGYSSGRIRRFLRQRGIRLTIPRRKNERHRSVFSREEYRLRNRVERLINRMKQFRRVATRYEKLARNYEAMLEIAAIRVWHTV